MSCAQILTDGYLKPFLDNLGKLYPVAHFQKQNNTFILVVNLLTYTDGFFDEVWEPFDDGVDSTNLVRRNNRRQKRDILDTAESDP